LLAAAQGLEFLKPLKPGQGVGRTYSAVRKVAAPLDGDRPFTADIEQIAKRRAGWGVRPRDGMSGARVVRAPRGR